MISRSSRCRVFKPITCCSVRRWASTPRGMKCPQHKKQKGLSDPLNVGCTTHPRTPGAYEGLRRLSWSLPRASSVWLRPFACGDETRPEPIAQHKGRPGNVHTSGRPEPRAVLALRLVPILWTFFERKGRIHAAMNWFNVVSESHSHLHR